MTYIPARGGPGIPVGIEIRGDVAKFMTVYDNNFHFEFNETRALDPLKGRAPDADSEPKPSESGVILGFENLHLCVNALK